MTYNAGTATDYIDFLDQLVQVATGRHLSTVAVNAAGTGYEAGEILNISGTGGTSTHVAQIEVLTVGGSGEVLTARVYRGGAYTVDPTTTTANASTTTDLLFDGTAVATTGASGATFDLTFAATGWTQLTRDKEAASAVVAAGGTGYSVSDVLTLQGGVLKPGGSAATFTVATLSGSAVATVTLTSAGAYEVFPSNPVLTSVAPSGGTGCTLTVTTTDISGDTTVVLQGDAGAATDPIVGIRTYSDQLDETGINTAYNWALFGMTAWSDQFRLDEQSNISPGLEVGGAMTLDKNGDGAFVPLKDADAFNIEWNMSVTGRRIVFSARVEGVSTVYEAQGHLGFLNALGTNTEYDYPLYIAGASDRVEVWYRDTSSLFGGLAEAISRGDGPAFFWSPDNEWLAARSSRITSNTSLSPTLNASNVSPRVNVWPLCHTLTNTSVNDALWTTHPTAGFGNPDLTQAAGAVAIYATPDTGGDKTPYYPVTIKQDAPTDGDLRTFGEIDGVFWFHQGDTSASSRDRSNQGAERFTIFQNGTRIEPYSFLAIRED